MSPAIWFAFTLAAGAAAGALVMRNRHLQLRRESFIRGYVFPQTLLTSLSKTYPSLERKDMFLVARALRSYFLAHMRSGGQLVGMPSKAVDALWHEFILHTRTYHAFCKEAFGAYFHHVPAAQMRPGVSSDTAMRRTWRAACLEDNIDPHVPTRLPLLFAIDDKLHIPDGNRYSLTQLQMLARNPGEDSGSSSGCGGYACSGGGLASSDSDGSDGGGGDGCGGGGCGGD